MASPSKRKADDLDTAVNGTGSKRVRTETPPTVNGASNGRILHPDPADRTTQSPLSRKAAKALRKENRRKLQQKDDQVSAEPKAVASGEALTTTVVEKRLKDGQENNAARGMQQVPTGKSPKATKKRSHRKQQQIDDKVIAEPPAVVSGEVTKTVVTSNETRDGQEKDDQFKRRKSEDGQEEAQTEAAPDRQPTQWEVTTPAGGALADLDPIFSHDEQ